MVIVPIRGTGTKGTPGLAPRVFIALGNHNITGIAIAPGASEANSSLVVIRAEADQAVQAIHDAFGLGKDSQ